MPYISLDPATAAPAPVITAGAPLVSVGETLQSMQEEIVPALGTRTDVPIERITFWINQGYQDLASSLDIETLYSSYTQVTVTGQPMYGLPLAVASIQNLSVADPTYQTYGGRPLEMTDLDEYRMARDLENRPRAYFRHGQIIVIYPTPNSAYNLAVDFKVRPAKLVNPTDSPILPPEWHEAIIVAALEKGYRRLMEFDKAMVMQNELVGLIRRKTDEKAEAETGRVVLSSVPGRHRETIRGTTPRDLADDYGLH